MKTAGLAVATIILVILAIFVVNKSIKKHTPAGPDPELLRMSNSGGGQAPAAPAK